MGLPTPGSTALTLVKFLCDHLFIDQGSLPMPEFNSSCVIQYGWVADRIICLHHPIGPILDISCPYLFSECHEVLPRFAFVHEKEHVNHVQCFDRLHSDVFRIAGTNADQIELSHRYDFLRWKKYSSQRSFTGILQVLEAHLPVGLQSVSCVSVGDRS